jgi:hypothetical protein
VEVVVEEGEEEASRRWRLWAERRVERVPRLFIGEGRGGLWIFALNWSIVSFPDLFVYYLLT